MKKVLLTLALIFSAVYLCGSEINAGSKITVYKEAYSGAGFYTVDKGDYLNTFFNLKKGEIATFKLSDFDLSMLGINGLVEVLGEKAGDSYIKYYTYPSARYSAVVKGKKVNMQCAVSGDCVTVGVPVIYGSF